MQAGVSQEAASDVTISTCHTAKGREWDHVRIAEDFAPPDTRAMSSDELMLAYVACTRARVESQGIAPLARPPRRLAPATQPMSSNPPERGAAAMIHKQAPAAVQEPAELIVTARFDGSNWQTVGTLRAQDKTVVQVQEFTTDWAIGSSVYFSDAFGVIVVEQPSISNSADGSETLAYRVRPRPTRAQPAPRDWTPETADARDWDAYYAGPF